MKNKEKYLQEMIDVILRGSGNCAFKRKHVLKKEHCLGSSDKNYISCEKCRWMTIAWLEEECKEPEIDWSKVPVDTPVLVWDEDDDDRGKRCFAAYLPDRIPSMPFASFGYGSNHNTASVITLWKHCVLAPEVDPTPFYKED